MESFGGCLKLKNRLLAWISVKSVRDMTLMQPIQPLQVGLDPKINKTKQTFSYPSCNFIALRGAIKLCCCINRWSISCRLPNLSPTPLHRFHRHDIHGIQRCLWRLYICLLLCEKYSGGCGSYDPSILNGVFNVFLPIKATHFVVYFSKEYDMATSNRDYLLLSRPSSDMISPMINSVLEHANNCDNFSIHWYSFSLGATSQTLSLFLIHSQE